MSPDHRSTGGNKLDGKKKGRKKKNRALSEPCQLVRKTSAVGGKARASHPLHSGDVISILPLCSARFVIRGGQSQRGIFPTRPLRERRAGACFSFSLLLCCMLNAVRPCKLPAKQPCLTPKGSCLPPWCWDQSCRAILVCTDRGGGATRIPASQLDAFCYSEPLSRCRPASVQLCTCHAESS